MGLLGTYIYAGAFSLANGANCLATGLPTTADWVGYTPISTVSLPVLLTTRTGGTIILQNNNTGTQGEVLAPVFHSLIR